MQREKWIAVTLVVAVLAIAFGGPWVVRQVRSLPRADALAARAHQRIVTLEVGGMTCGGCAATVQTQLAKVPGVSTVEVRFPQHRAYIVCDPAVADSSLVQAVHRSGPGFLAVVAER